MLCPPLYSLRAQGAQAGATLNYWQGVLKQNMLRLEFKERGWNTELGTDELINANVKVKKLVYECQPHLAVERLCKGNCSCWGRRLKLCSLKTEAEAPVPTAAQEHLKPDGVDGTLRSIVTEHSTMRASRWAGRRNMTVRV